MAGSKSWTLRASASVVALSAAVCLPVSVSAQEVSPGTGTAAQQTAIPMPSAAPEGQTPLTPEIDAPADSEEGSNGTTGGQDIVVTGSRLGRSSYNSPTPVAVIGQDRVKNLSLTNLGDALNQLPSFRPISTPASNLFRVSSTIAARTVDLRGLGPSRTLVLVDGRRFVPTNENGNVDLNAIPSALVSRTEVVTGGASAAYGADAVAGVVNLIMDTRFTGWKAEASQGISERGDANVFNASAAFGSGFAGDKGHVVFGVEHTREGGVGDCNVREFCRRHTNFVANPGFNTNPALSNGLPATLVLDNVLFVVSPNGIIQNGPLRGTTFNEQGQPVPFTFGNYLSGTLMQGGDPTVRSAYVADEQKLVTPSRYTTLFGHADYAFSDALEISVEGSYASVIGGPSLSAVALDFGRTVQIDNAFLPAATRAAMAAARVMSIGVNKLYTELGAQPEATSRNKVFRGVFAVKGKLGGEWSYDAYYQYGRTTGRTEIVGQRLSVENSRAIDAVFVTPANVGNTGLTVGSIVCRTRLAGINDGCVPYNIFGPDVGDPAVAGYINKPAFQTRRFTQQVVSGSLRGKAFDTWAGPVRVAVGAEYREDRYSGTADPFSAAGRFAANFASVLPAGGQNVTEGYAEMSVPLLKDSKFGEALDIDGAVRRTHYSRLGNSTTWKLGGVYRPDQGYMLRVTRSHDIRAPSAAELSPITTDVRVPINDPINRVTTQTRIVSGGNPDLRLETADTFTAGIALQPSWLRNFRMSVDYYKIDVKDAIDTVAAQASVNACAAGNTAVCALVSRDAAGQLTNVTQQFQNLSRLRARGIEFQSDYNFDLDQVASWASGNLAFSLTGSYVIELSTISAIGQKREFSNWTGNPGSITNILGVPRWRVQGVVTYSQPDYSLTAAGRYIPRSLLDPDKIGPEQDGYSVSLPNSISVNHVDPRFYLDLSARIKIKDGNNGRVEVFGNINNVFDTQQPEQLRLFGNPLYYDTIGRSFKIGVRAQY